MLDVLQYIGIIIILLNLSYFGQLEAYLFLSWVPLKDGPCHLW